MIRGYPQFWKHPNGGGEVCIPPRIPTPFEAEVAPHEPPFWQRRTIEALGFGGGHYLEESGSQDGDGRRW